MVLTWILTLTPSIWTCPNTDRTSEGSLFRKHLSSSSESREQHVDPSLRTEAASMQSLAVLDNILRRVARYAIDGGSFARDICSICHIVAHSIHYIGSVLLSGSVQPSRKKRKAQVVAAVGRTNLQVSPRKEMDAISSIKRMASRKGPWFAAWKHPASIPKTACLH